MTEGSEGSSGLSRRGFLGAAGAAVSAAVLPLGAARAQGPAKFRRLNVTNPQAARAVDSYKKAIRAMLALPPTDPRHWYRHVLVHTLDCPHGNWWFLPWHRGYLGWFEQICRELSDDPEFALPYWDWSENPDPSRPFAPRIPAVMFDDVLTPTNGAYIDRFTFFESIFKDVLARADYWKFSIPFDSRTQYGQLLNRGLRFNEDLWFDIDKDPRGRLFYGLGEARGLSRDRPELDSDTTAAVSRDSVLAALRPTDFVGFASGRAPNHSAARASGPLESGPHNLVHNNISGFMGDFMSPTDPIFFLHHANLDRLWDVWTRKQQLRGLPTLPDGHLVQPPVQGTDFFQWSREPFLFFSDAQGRPVTKTQAGDYASIGEFNYDYQPGTGEEVVALPVAAAAPQVQRFSARITDPVVQGAKAASAAVTLPPALVQAAANATAPLFAKVTVDMPEHAGKLRVFVGGPADLSNTGPESPHYAGSISMFGRHLVPVPFTFTVPVPAPAARAAASAPAAAGSPLNIRVVAVADAMPHAAGMGAPRAATRAEVLSIEVEAY